MVVNRPKLSENYKDNNMPGPYSDAVKRQALINLGLNPDENVIDDSGFVTPKPKIQPSVSQENVGQLTTVPAQRNVAQTSALTTGLKSATQSAFPTLTALAGGAASSQLFPGAHVFPPWSEIVAGTIGAIATGYGGAKLQEAVVPQEIQAKYFPSPQEVEEHPYANIIGSIIPSTAAFSPVASLRNIAAAGRVGANVAAAGRATEAQRAALAALGINTGINVGVGGGMNIARQLSGDKPFDYGELALEAGLSGLLNQPRKPFLRYFGDSSIPPTPPEGLIPPLPGRPPIPPDMPGPGGRPHTVTKPPGSPPEAPAAEPPKAPLSPEEQLKAMLIAEGEKRRIELEKAADDIVKGVQREQPTSFSGTKSYIAVRPQSRDLAQRRGFRYEEDPNLPTAGRFTPPQRKVSVGPKAGGDTPSHEVAHGYLLDLANSSDPKDHRLLERGLKAGGTKMTRDEYLAMVNSKTPDMARIKAIEEPLAEAIGLKSFDRFRGEAYGLKGWARDVKNHLKAKLGLASPEEVVAYLTAAMHRDAPYGTRAGMTPKRETGGFARSRYQEESSLNDRERYDDVQAKMAELIKAKKIDTPEFQTLWRENERIKNLHGGMPPPPMERLRGAVADAFSNRAKPKSGATVAEQDFMLKLSKTPELGVIYRKLQDAYTDAQRAGNTEEMLSKAGAIQRFEKALGYDSTVREQGESSLEGDESTIPLKKLAPYDLSKVQVSDELIGKYGWMTPDGRFVKVPNFERHQEILEKMGLSRHTDAVKHGFIHISGDDKTIEVFGKLSNKQKRILMDTAMEKGKVLRHFTTSMGPEGKESYGYKDIREQPESSLEGGKFRKRNEDETLTDYLKAKHAFEGHVPEPYEQTPEELRNIINNLEKLYAKNPSNLNKFRLNKARQQLQYQVDNPREQPESSLGGEETPGDDIDYEAMQGKSIDRMLNLIDTGIYKGRDLGIISRELTQNARDAFHGYNVPQKEITEFVDNKNKIYAYQDNGKGMDAKTFLTKYLPPITSGKGVGEGGGFGLAKGIVLGRPEEFKIVTTAPDAKTGELMTITLRGSGDGWKNYAKDFLKNKLGPEAKNTNFDRIDFNDNLYVTRRPAAPGEERGTTYFLKDDSLDFNSVERTNQFEALHKSFKTKTYDRQDLSRAFEDDSAVGFPKSGTPVEHPKPYTKVYDTVDTPDYTIELLYNPDAPVKESSSVDAIVSSNGSYQFTKGFDVGGWGETAVVPQKMLIDIQPKVEAENDNYPFTINRDDVKNDVQYKIRSVFKEAVRKAKANIRNLYDKALNNENLKTSKGHKVSNFFEEFTQADVDRIEKDAPVVNDFATILASVFKDTNVQLQHLAEESEMSRLLGYGANPKELVEKAVVGGLTTHPGVFGVNIYNPQHDRYESYVNPFLIAKTALKIFNHPDNKSVLEDIVARLLVDTSSHEVTHNLEREEGAGLSRAFTFMKSRESESLLKNYKKALQQFLSIDDFKPQLDSLNAELQKHDAYDQQTERSVFDSGKERQNWDKPSSLRVSEEPDTSMGTGETEQTTRPRREDSGGGIREQEKSPISEEDVETTKSPTDKAIEEITEKERLRKLKAKYAWIEEGSPKEFNDEDFRDTLNDIRLRNQGESSLEDADVEPPNIPPKGLGIFRSDLDELRALGGDNERIADAFDEVLNVARQNVAKLDDTLIQALQGLGRKGRKKLYEHLLQEQRTKQTSEPSPDIAEAYEMFREGLRSQTEDQIAANHPVKNNAGKFVLPTARDYTMFNVPSHKVMEVITKGNKNSPEYQRLRDDFLDHYETQGFSAEQADKAFDDITSQYGGSSLKTNYSATRRDESIGLPDSWIEKDFSLATKRYINRVAKDRAWFDVIESKPELNMLMGGTTDPFGVRYGRIPRDINIAKSPLVRRAAQNVVGFKDYSQSTKIEALSRPITAAMLGPLTGVGDLIGSTFGMMKYVNPTQIPELVAGYGKAFQGYKNALKTGLTKRDATSMYEVGLLSSSFEDRLSQAANLIHKYSGRSFLENISRGLSQAAGETIATMKLAEARAGDKDAISFLKRIANKRDYEALDIKELGTRIAQLQQGTYDVRQLPNYALNSSIAPFLKLARWNIGNTNEFAKAVINPAMKGNFAPLITSLFGSVAGGYIIKDLRERISNKKDIVPSLKEIAAGDKEDKAGLYAWNLAGAAAYAGFAGLLGDMVKATLDVAHDTKPQGFTFPTVELGADLVAKSAQAAQAIAEGEDIAKVAIAFNKDLGKTHVQTMRLLLNNIDKVQPEGDLTRDARRTEYRNDLRRFKQVSEGGEVSPLLGTGLFEDNPYIGLDAKEFKRTEDIGEAAELLPGLLSSAIGNAHGDPYKLKQELRKLKANSYTTMPNPESMPLSFAKYIAHLSTTQGEEAASQRLTDYFLQNARNKAKSRMIP